MTNVDLPADLLALAARIDDGQPIDWDAEERHAADATARAVVHNFRVLAGVAAVARTDEPDLAGAPGSANEPPPRARAGEGTGLRWGAMTLAEVVGQGAFSTVYRATDSLSRDVAVKLLDPRLDRDDLQARVLAEGRLLASVTHKNIVVVHGADEHDGRVGLWMEFVRGRTLAAEVEARGAHGAEEAIVIGRALCGALAAVHAKGLVHGDVKAHNVMREDGGRVVLMDFGAGQAMERARGGVEVLAGTPLYLCPERLQGGPATAATDIYSLGVLLYYLVSGRYPVEGASRSDVDAAHRAGQRVRLRDRRPNLPDTFIAAVERAIAPEPATRFATAGAFEAALAAAAAPADRPAVATLLTNGPAPGIRGRRPARLAIGLGAVAILGVATAVTLWQRTPVGTLSPVPGAPSLDLGSGAHFTVTGEFQRVVAGKREPLPPGTRIEPDTDLVFELTPSRSVYVYIVNEDDKGESYALFPLKDSPKNPLAGGRAHLLPSASRPWFVTSAGGREHLFVVVSATPLPEVADAVSALPQAGDDSNLEGTVAFNGRGTGGRRRASAADAARPWRRDAKPLVAGLERAEGVWVRELVLENPPRP